MRNVGNSNKTLVGQMLLYDTLTTSHRLISLTMHRMNNEADITICFIYESVNEDRQGPPFSKKKKQGTKKQRKH